MIFQKIKSTPIFILLGLGIASITWADPVQGGTAHHSPVAPVLIALVLMLFGSRVVGHLFNRFGQPTVLGELLFGVALGALSLLNVTHLDFIKTDRAIEVLAEIGVVLLLFQVGLESDMAQMRKVGLTSFLVAVVGVLAPFFFGWGVSQFFFPQRPVYVHIFIGATLCATSVGITARVLQELNKVNTPEARIILGAAVIDDVLGLVILAIVQGLILAADRGASLSVGAILIIFLKAGLFLAGALMIGPFLSQHFFRLANRLEAQGLLLSSVLGFCFFFSWLASLIGLAPIVGAFAAGLILEEVHYRDLAHREEHQLEDILEPIGAFLTPIFFVLMGARVDITTFLKTDILAFALFLTLAAILGKQACSLVAGGEGVKRSVVGLGMIPRGEVGLIFASIGAGLTLKGVRVVDSGAYSAVVIMVMMTTLMTPPLLKWIFSNGSPQPVPEVIQRK